MYTKAITAKKELVNSFEQSKILSNHGVPAPCEIDLTVGSLLYPTCASNKENNEDRPTVKPAKLNKKAASNHHSMLRE